MREPAGEEAGGVRPAAAQLPVLGEVPTTLWRAVCGGQPVALTRAGRPDGGGRGLGQLGRGRGTPWRGVKNEQGE